MSSILKINIDIDYTFNNLNTYKTLSLFINITYKSKIYFHQAAQNFVNDVYLKCYIIFFFFLLEKNYNTI